MRPDSVPKLARGCRLSENSEHGAVLLVPEGVLRLTGPGPEILRRCDGLRSFSQIVSELAGQFGAAQPDRIEAETAAFLERLRDRHIIVFE
jgi:pyrroloquinoline quinone biosynthesis protein D